MFQVRILRGVKARDGEKGRVDGVCVRRDASPGLSDVTASNVSRPDTDTETRPILGGQAELLEEFGFEPICAAAVRPIPSVRVARLAREVRIPRFHVLRFLHVDSRGRRGRRRAPPWLGFEVRVGRSAATELESVQSIWRQIKWQSLWI